MRHPNVPMINVLSRILSLFKPIFKMVISNAAIASKVISAPAYPKSVAITQKIKSVCPSGNTLTTALNPCPNNPAVP